MNAMTNDRRAQAIADARLTRSEERRARLTRMVAHLHQQVRSYVAATTIQHTFHRRRWLHAAHKLRGVRTAGGPALETRQEQP